MTNKSVLVVRFGMILLFLFGMVIIIFREESKALIYLSKMNQNKRIEKFVNRGADVNYIDKNGDTSLIIASKNANLELAKFLLDHGALVNIKNKQGLSAIDYAQKASDNRLISLLKKYRQLQLEQEKELQARMLHAMTNDPSYW